MNKNCVFALTQYSLENLKKELIKKFDHEWFRKYYIYDINGISTMLYYTLRKPEIIKKLLKDKDTYFNLSSDIGIEITNYKDVDTFGHSGYSMHKTVIITQQIIKKGIDNIANFYKQ